MQKLSKRFALTLAAFIITLGSYLRLKSKKFTFLSPVVRVEVGMVRHVVPEKLLLKQDWLALRLMKTCQVEVAGKP